MTETEPRLRVLFCIPELDRGGPDSVYFNLLRTLDLERFEPYLAVTKPTGAYLSELPSHIPVLPAGHGRYPVRSVIHHVRGSAPRRRPRHPAHVVHLRGRPPVLPPFHAADLSRGQQRVGGARDVDPPHRAGEVQADRGLVPLSWSRWPTP